MTLEERTKGLSASQLTGRSVTIVGGCDQEGCFQQHSYGEFTLICEMLNKSGIWLAIAPDNTLVWLQSNYAIASSSIRSDSHRIPPVSWQRPSVGAVIVVIEEWLKPHTINQATATPGCYWWHQQCRVCQKLRFEKTLWLNTTEEVQKQSGTLAIIVSKPLSDLLAQVLRAGNAICKCP